MYDWWTGERVLSIRFSFLIYGLLNNHVSPIYGHYTDIGDRINGLNNSKIFGFQVYQTFLIVIIEQLTETKLTYLKHFILYFLILTSKVNNEINVKF